MYNDTERIEKPPVSLDRLSLVSILTEILEKCPTNDLNDRKRVKNEDDDRPHKI